LDHVLVMNGGAMVAFGPRDDVLRKTTRPTSTSTSTPASAPTEAPASPDAETTGEPEAPKSGTRIAI